MAATARVHSDHRQEPELHPGLHMGAGAQAFLCFFPLLFQALAGNWIRSGTGESPAVPIWDAGIYLLRHSRSPVMGLLKKYTVGVERCAYG